MFFTGTCKTLAAFLVFIDKLKAQAREGTLSQELHLIYVSPLKSLAGDIRENLRRPLLGIAKSEGQALEILTALGQRDSAVENNGLYYHAEPYDKARRETIKSRRR